MNWIHLVYILPHIVSISGVNDTCYTCNTGGRRFGCYKPRYTESGVASAVCTHGCLLRLTQYADGNTGVTRGCAPDAIQVSRCSQTLTGAGHVINNCVCQGDLCNDAAVTPDEELRLRQCYTCTYYASTHVAHVVNSSCLYPSQQYTDAVFCPHGHCRKIYFTTGAYRGIGRACVEKVELPALDCHQQQSADGGQHYDTCHCDGDLCNAAPGIQHTATLLIILISGWFWI